MRLMFCFLLVFSSVSFAGNTRSLVTTPNFNGLNWVQSESGTGHFESCEHSGCKPITGEMDREELAKFTSYLQDRVSGDANLSYSEVYFPWYVLMPVNLAAAAVVAPSFLLFQSFTELMAFPGQAYLWSIPVGFVFISVAEYVGYRKNQKQSRAVLAKTDDLRRIRGAGEQEFTALTPDQHAYLVDALERHWKSYSRAQDVKGHLRVPATLCRSGALAPCFCKG